MYRVPQTPVSSETFRNEHGFIQLVNSFTNAIQPMVDRKQTAAAAVEYLHQSLLSQPVVSERCAQVGAGGLRASEGWLETELSQ